jgi:hypothetical protein
MCLFAVLAGMFPRFAFAIYWIARPTQVALVFGDNLIWPLLGLAFLPFTTLIYVVLWGPGGLSGGDFLWVGLAFLLDMGHYASSGYTNRDRIPGYGTPNVPT